MKRLINDGYNFQPIVFKVQGAADASTVIFLNELCKSMSTSIEEPRAGNFSSAENLPRIQVANAACVLGTIK